MKKEILDFNEGDSFEFSKIITSSLMNGFLELSGDTNPMHVDEGFATEHGLKGRIAYGNILGLLVSRMVGVELNTDNLMIISQRLDFHAPLYLNDEVQIISTVSAVSDSVNTVEMKLKFFNQKRIMVAKGKVMFKLI